MKTNDFERLLVANGFILTRSSKHRIWVRGDKRVAVPHQKTINRMLARRVLKEIGHKGRVEELNLELA